MAVVTPFPVERALAVVNRWFDETAARHAPSQAAFPTEDNPLRAADYALTVNCDAQRITLESDAERFRENDADSDDWLGALTAEEVNRVWIPAITSLIEQRLHAAFNYYRFRVDARFATCDGLLAVTLLDVVNTAKIDQLRCAMETWQRQVLEEGDAPTDTNSTLFYCSNALNTDLYPQPDIAGLLRGCARIEQLNRSHPALAEHRHWMVFQLSEWIEQHFLPRYFTVEKSGWGERHYHLKPQATLLVDSEDGAQPLDLLLYVAVLILRFEPSYSKPTGLQYLALAQQLGSEKAGRYLREGSGTLADCEHRSPQMHGCANDVLAHITLHMREESCAAYQQALDFIVRLLEQGFPRHYHITLKSTVKAFLPVKGLARSDTHRFFANSLGYPELHGVLERYARVAIHQYEWYADAEAEKNCMPGSYAVFGLALTSARYFPLLCDYMSQVDDEHQSVQDAFISAFIGHYRLNEQTLPVLVCCLCRATGALKIKLQSQLDDESLLRLLAAQLARLPSHSVEHILTLVWGKRDKVVKLAAKADGDKQSLYQALLRAADKDGNV